jgi:hypothetical protein
MRVQKLIKITRGYFFLASPDSLTRIDVQTRSEHLSHKYTKTPSDRTNRIRRTYYHRTFLCRVEVYNILYTRVISNKIHSILNPYNLVISKTVLCVVSCCIRENRNKKFSFIKIRSCSHSARITHTHT